MPAIIEDESLANKVLLEQVKLQFQSLPNLLLLNLILCISIPYMFWNIAPHSSVYLWVGLILVASLVRVFVYQKYKQRINVLHLEKLKWIVIISSAFSGIVYGMAGIIFFSETLFEYQVLLLCLLLGLTAVSSFTLSIYMPSYFVFSPLTLLPITLKLMTMGDKLYLSLAIMLVIFLIALSLFNIKLNKNFKRSLMLRFENLDLIKQLEEQKTQLQEQKDEAERANQAKSKFLAAASHDLRQPLYSLSLFTSILDEMTKDEKTRKIIEKINMSVDSLKGLFDALLDISKLDAGVIVAKKDSLSLKPLFNKLANSFDLAASEKGLLIHWPENCYNVISEDKLLEQILRNYIENAIRYTEEGSITVQCEEKGEEEGEQGNNRVVIRVTDTGIGIEQAELHNIFNEFHQVGNAERDRKKGLGLGLAIVDRTAKLLGHEISVISKPGAGSTFSIAIEQADSTVDGLNAPKLLPHAHDPLAQGDSANNSAMYVAIVDDEENIREGLIELLQLWNYRTIAAASSAELMALLAKSDNKPDVLITDFRLRDNQTGMDVIAAVKAHYQQDIPVLIVTGDTDKERIEQMNAGHHQVLYKPVSTAKLRAFLLSIQAGK
jgi:signal transduction histidine kinase